MAIIVKSEIILISPQGKRSYVIEEHISDDGTIRRVEGLRDNANFEQQMLDRVPKIETQMIFEAKVRKLSADAQSAEVKVQNYLKGVSLKTAAGLTDAEIAAREDG